MLDVEPTLPPDQNTIAESAMQEPRQEPGEVSRAVIWGLMPLVAVGFVVALVALLLLRWPVPGNNQGQTFVPLSITSAPPTDEGEVSLARRLVDLGIYLIVMIGVIFLAIAWLRRTRSAVIGLMGVAILGLAYAGGMALYIGPMISICGFSLILFGGLVALAASSPADASTESVEIRTNDHASHSVA